MKGEGRKGGGDKGLLFSFNKIYPIYFLEY